MHRGSIPNCSVTLEWCLSLSEPLHPCLPMPWGRWRVTCEIGLPRGEAGEGSRLPGVSQAPGGSESLCFLWTEKRCPPSSMGGGGGGDGSRGHLLRQLRGLLGTESVTLSGTAPGWEPPDDPDTGSECSHPEVSPSPRFVAAKTQTNQSGKKASASVVRCSALLHRTPPATQTQTFRTPNSGSPANKATSGTNGLCHPTRPPFPLPPPATAVPGVIVPLQEQQWGSHSSVGRIWVLALPLTGPETLASRLTNLSESKFFLS